MAIITTDPKSSAVVGVQTLSAVGDDSSSNASIQNEQTASLLGGEARYDDGDVEGLVDLAWNKRPSVVWLLPPFCLFTVAFGVTTVPRLNIILSLLCKQYFAAQDHGPGGSESISVLIDGDGSNKQCQIPEVQAIVSKFALYLSLVSSILSAFTSPRLGALSDLYGRRAVISFSAFGLLTSEITMILAAKYPDIFSINILFVGAVVDGLCGSFMLGMALAYAYGADCTSSAKRAVAFGYFQGCLFLGIAIGPALGGLVIKYTGSVFSVFYTALGAYIVFILYLMVILPESLSQERMQLAREKYAEESETEGRHFAKTVWDSLNPVNLLTPLNILYPTGPGSSPALRLNLILLAIIDCVIFGVGIGSMTVIIIYAELKFEWGNFESAIYLSIVNFARVTMLFVVLPLIIKIFRRPRNDTRSYSGSDMLDIVLIRFSIIVETIGYLSYTFAQTAVAFTAAGTMISFGGVGSPTLQSSLTKHIPSDKTGQLLGATALLHALARVITPTIFNLVYANTVGTFPQTVFICLGSTFAIALVSSWFIKPNVYLHDGSAAAQVDEQAPLFPTISDLLPGVVADPLQE